MHKAMKQKKTNGIRLIHKTGNDSLQNQWEIAISNNRTEKSKQTKTKQDDVGMKVHTKRKQNTNTVAYNSNDFRWPFLLLLNDQIQAKPAYRQCTKNGWWNKASYDCLHVDFGTTKCRKVDGAGSVSILKWFRNMSNTRRHILSMRQTRIESIISSNNSFENLKAFSWYFSKEEPMNYMEYFF